MSETAVDSLITLGQQARLIENTATHRTARKLAGQAVQCATAGIQAHNEGAFDSANLHAGKAAEYLRDAARIHAGTLMEETPSPDVLDAAHLGGAQKLHQNYVDAINEGKKNGR
jgi:hypothetical protein